MPLSLSAVLFVDVVSALCAHGYFHSYDEEVDKLAFIVLFLPPTVQVFLFLHNLSLLQAIFFSFSVYYATLATSIVAYRISPFHPLYQYPGPLLCRITKLTSVWFALHENTHQWMLGLHRRYGPIVRTGPNELAVIDKDLIPFILGSQGMPKGPVWDGRRFGEKGGKIYDGLITLRDLEAHAILRKPWNKAFSTSPVKGYGKLLTKNIKKLIHGLEEICLSSPDGVGKIDLARWVTFLAFDFMGDLTFSTSFNTLKRGDASGMIQGMYNSMVLPNITQHVPWSLPLVRKLPLVNSGMDNMMSFAQTQVKKRLKETPTNPDLFYYMIEAAKDFDSEVNPEALVTSNSILAIIAGSDTTASVLSNIFYYLMLYPNYMRRLRDEIDPIFSDAGVIDADQLTNLGFLNAVINETLRLQPAVPTYLNRAPSKGSSGKVLGKNIFIPERTSVIVSPYAMHRDPRYFSPKPDEFWPERWLHGTSPKTIHDDDEPIILARDAFIPFSVGPANCAGKPLALIELRLVVANLVRRFDISFDENYDPRTWEKMLFDRFVMVKGQLMTVLRLRKL